MGAGAGFDLLAQANVQRRQMDYEDKQRARDLQFQNNFDKLQNDEKDIQLKYSSTLDKAGKPTADSQQWMDALAKNHADQRQLYDEFIHPEKNPGAIQRLGGWIAKRVGLEKPAPSITTEVGAITIPGTPPAARGGTASANGAAPSLGTGPAISLPGQKVTITEVPQKQFDKQQALQAKNLATDREAAAQAAAGAPIGPVQEAAMKTDAANEAWLSMFDTKMKQLRQADPNLSPEEAQRATLELMGVRVPLSYGQPQLWQLGDGTQAEVRFSPDGSAVYANGAPVDPDLLVGAKQLPKVSAAPHTILNQEQDAYAKSYGFDDFSKVPAALQYAAQQYVQQKAKLDTQFGRATRSTTMKQDINGNEIPVTVWNYSTPVGMVKLEDPLSELYPHATVTGAQGGNPEPKATGTARTPVAAPPRPSAHTAAPKPQGAQGSQYAKVGPPLFKGRTPTTDKDYTAARAAYSGYQEVLKEASNTTPVDSQDMVMTWLKGRVNRVTATEIQAVRNLGGAFQKFDGNVNSILHGTMTPEQISWFVKSAKERYDVAQNVWKQDQSMGATSPDEGDSGTGGFDWNNTSLAPVHQGGR